ncbi:MAG: hypothetical protein NZM25_01445 [Leptospiraceae bacterium]|nr:hypothetical protein [Leptospiraceae bacterium]MDW8306390.1 hypothetical protein [Leptospiraceae bacterium]
MARRLANKARRNLPKTTELGRRHFSSNEEKIKEYQKKIRDEEYMEIAIERIASELLHFLLR